MPNIEKVPTQEKLIHRGFFMKNAQINLQSNDSNFCIRFHGSKSLFADKHLLMTTTEPSVAGKKCAASIGEKYWLYSEMKRFFQQGAGHSQRVLCYWYPVNKNQVDSCDM